METATPQPATEPSEAALLERHRRGDPAAFDAIVARHRQVVYLTARRILGTHEDADEATQQAFVRAWKSLDRFRGEATVRTWLIRIVLNVAKTMHASRRTFEDAELLERVADDRRGSDEEVGLDQARAGVRRAVEGLPPRQREVVMLKVFGEMTYREVAQALELSEGTVKAHLNQAVSNLRRRMTATQAGRSG